MEGSAGAPAPGERKALVVANRLPWPLDDGWKRRTYHLLKGLLREYRVTLATLHGGDRSELEWLVAELGDGLEVAAVPPASLAMPRAVVLGLVTGRPYHVWRQRSRALRGTIAHLPQRYDVAVATLVHLYPYIAHLESSRIVDTHNIDSLVLERYADTMSGPRRWYARLTAARLARHEREVFQAADLVIVCSEAERRRVLAEIPGARIRVLSNGVDVDGAFRRADVAPDFDRLVFFGRLDYFPNSDAVQYFAEEILPAIQERAPATTFDVVGPGAPSRLRARLEGRPGIRFLGAVDDLRQVVGSAAVVVVPLRSGGGTRLKILEALALGRPVVTTPVGVEGLDLAAGRDLMIEDKPIRFAEAVVQLLRTPDLASALGDAGRFAVRRAYSWARIEEGIPDLIRNAPRRRV